MLSGFADVGVWFLTSRSTFYWWRVIFLSGCWLERDFDWEMLREVDLEGCCFCLAEVVVVGCFFIIS